MRDEARGSQTGSDVAFCECDVIFTHLAFTRGRICALGSSFISYDAIVECNISLKPSAGMSAVPFFFLDSSARLFGPLRKLCSWQEFITMGPSNNGAGESSPAQLQEQEIFVEERNVVRILTLNRPRVLNCLSLPMISRMAELFEQWENDNGVCAILIKGAGRVFCAGGDLRMFYDAGKKDESWKEVVYKKYWLDYHLHTYKKTMISIVIWHGLVMGGGAGFTLPSRFRIVTEKAQFSMPEVALGFHTDCGASYFLSRLPGHLGEYLALTGSRLNSAEMLACGLATHFIPSEHLPEVERHLLDLHSGEGESIRSIIEQFSTTIEVGEDSVLNRMAVINTCFSKDRMEDIIDSLVAEKREPDEKWLDKTVQTLKAFSPTGLKQTLLSIRGGRNKTLRECLKQEYRLTFNCLRGTISDDLYEGIRAIVVDKDNSPKWKPKTLAEVTDQMLRLNFQPLKEEEELQLPAETKTERWEGKYESRVRT